MLSATTTAFVSKVPIAFPSLPPPNPNVSTCGINNDGQIGLQRVTASKTNSLRLRLVTNSVSGDSSASVDVDVPFPSDYFELLQQARKATALALKDNRQLMEIEFPTAGLESVPGDGEGGIEMTGSMQLIREFCDSFINPEKATRTRIFFPEASEVQFARQSARGFWSFRKEMLVVEELYKEAVENTARKLIIFKGELDRIRSGYYPSFFYPKLAKLSKTLLPMMETVYYIHNFKGRNGGILFRCYPGPWKVLRKVGSKYICLHQQEVMPSLKEVALDILISA